MEIKSDPHLLGQVAALGMAVQAMLSTHPNREQVAQKLHDSIEQTLARALAQGFPDEFVRGVESIVSLYLLRRQEDPGQPSVR